MKAERIENNGFTFLKIIASNQWRPLVPLYAISPMKNPTVCITNPQICRHSRIGGNLKARYISIQPRNCIKIASRAGNDVHIKVIEKNVPTR